MSSQFTPSYKPTDSKYGNPYLPKDTKDDFSVGKIYLDEIYRLFLFDSRIDKKGNTSKKTYETIKYHISQKKNHYLETIDILPKSINFVNLFEGFFDIIENHTIFNNFVNNFEKMTNIYNLFIYSILSHQIAFLLKYIKTENTTKIYDFYILNAGFGMENHENKHKIINNVEHVPSVMIIQNVSDISIKTLFNLLNTNPSKTEFLEIVSMNHLYSIIKCILQCSFTEEIVTREKLLDLHHNPSSLCNIIEKNKIFLYTTSQNLHNCTFYSYLLSLYCIIYDELKDTKNTTEINEIYEYIKNYLKIKLLNDYLNDKISDNDINSVLLFEVQTINNKLFEILTNETIYDYNKNREKINPVILELYETLENKIIINRKKLIKKTLTINNQIVDLKKHYIKPILHNPDKINTEIILIKNKLLDKLNKLNMNSDNYNEWCEIVSIMIEMIYKTVEIFKIPTDSTYINTNILYYFIFIKYQNILYFNIFNKFIKFLEESKIKELKISDEYKEINTQLNIKYQDIFYSLKEYIDKTESKRNSISITLNLLFIFSIYIKINNHFNHIPKTTNFASKDITLLLSNILLTKENNNIHNIVSKFYYKYYENLRFGYDSNELSRTPKYVTYYNYNYINCSIVESSTYDVPVSESDINIDRFTEESTKIKFDNISFELYAILCRNITKIVDKSSKEYDDSERYSQVRNIHLEYNYIIKNSHITDINILNIYNNHINLEKNILVPYIGYSIDIKDPQYIDKLYSYNLNEYMSTYTTYDKYYKLLFNRVYLQRYIKINIADKNILFYIIFYIEIIGLDNFIENILNNKNNIYFRCLYNIIYEDSIDFELIYKFLYCIIKIFEFKRDFKINLNDNLIDTFDIYDFILYVIDKITHKLIIEHYDLSDNNLPDNNLPDIDFSLMKFDEIYKINFSKKIIIDIQKLINPTSQYKKDYYNYNDIIIIDYNINTQAILYNNIYYNVIKYHDTNYISLIYDKFNFKIFLNENNTNIIRELKYSKNNYYEYNVIDEPIINYKFNNYPDEIKNILTGYSLIDAYIFNIKYKDYISESQIKKYISSNFNISIDVIDETQNNIIITNIYNTELNYVIIPLKKIYKTTDNIEYKAFRIIYDKIFDFMKDYLFYNNLELIFSSDSDTNTILLLVEDISYVFKLEYELIDNDIRITYFMILDFKNNIRYSDIDYHLINIHQHIRYYLLDTPNMYCKIDMEDYILYVSQKGLNKIKINKNGLINNLPSENTFLYFLNSIGNNCYYNIYNLFCGAFAYLKTTKNELEYLKGKLYQIQQALNTKSIYLLYYLIKLKIFIKDLYETEKQNSSLDDLIDDLIDEKNLFFIINNVLPDVYSNHEINKNRYYYKLQLLNDDESFVNIKKMFSTFKDINADDRINPRTELGNIINYEINFNSKFIDDILPINIDTYDRCVELDEIYNNLKFPDILNVMLYDKSDNFKKILPLITLCSINQNERKISIWKNKKNILYRSTNIFEFLFGHFIRQDQYELKNKIFNSIFNEKEIFSFLMGSGKTSVIAPLLTLDLLRHFGNNYDNRIIHVMPESLVRSSYFLMSQYISPLCLGLNVYTNKKSVYKQDELDKIKFDRINITSDNFLKNYKLSNVILNNYISFQSDVLIFDEIDDLTNPLTNQMNINKCNIEPDKMNTAIDLTLQFMNLLYDSDKKLHDKLFIENEDSFVFQNDNLYNDFFKSLMNKMYQNDRIIENIFKLEPEGLSTDDMKLSEYLYNIYMNSKIVFKAIKNVNFGLSKKIDDDNFLAIPYLAVDTPVYGSEFSNIYQIIMFTIASYYSKKDRFEFRVNDIYKYLKQYIYDKYQIEKQDYLSNSFMIIDKFNGLLPDKSKNINNLESIINKTLSDDDIKSIIIKISNKENIREYTKNIIYEKIKNYELSYNISTYDLLLSKFTKTRTGFSGTPYMHIPIEHTNGFKSEINDLNKDFISKNISRQGIESSYKVIQNNNINDIIQIIIDENEKKNKYSVLIDTSAYIRDNIENVIQILFNKLKHLFDGIVFIDSNHIKKIISKDNHIEDYYENHIIPLDKRFYFFDNKHIIGQDFKIHIDAKGLITMSENTRFRDIAQGVYRLRQIGQNQICDILLTNVNIQIIKEKYKVSEINNALLYKILNDNETIFLNSSYNLFTREYWLSMVRLFYENLTKRYFIEENNISDICGRNLHVFKNNIYLIKNFKDIITKENYKKSIEQLINDEIYIFIASQVTDLSSFYSESKIKLIKNKDIYEPTIKTNISVDTTTEIQIQTTINVQTTNLLYSHLPTKYIGFKLINNNRSPALANFDKDNKKIFNIFDFNTIIGQNITNNSNKLVLFNIESPINALSSGIIGYIIWISNCINVKPINIAQLNLFIIFDNYYINNKFNFIIKTLLNKVIYRSRTYDEDKMDNDIYRKIGLLNYHNFINPFVKLYIINENYSLPLYDYEIIMLILLFEKTGIKSMDDPIINNFSTFKRIHNIFFTNLSKCFTEYLNIKSVHKPNHNFYTMLKILDTNYINIYVKLFMIDYKITSNTIIQSRYMIKNQYFDEINYILFSYIDNIIINRNYTVLYIVEISELNKYYKSLKKEMSGGNNNIYKNKYLKYKNKYLKLKQIKTNK